MIIPGSAQTYGSATATAYGNGNAGVATGYYNTTTTYTPAQQVNYECAYVVFARKTNPSGQGPADWLVEGFKRPNFMCE
jgi:hypothetical protein